MVSEREKLDRELRNNARALLGYGVIGNVQIRKPVRLTRRTKRRLLRNGFSLDEYEKTRIASTDEDDTDSGTDEGEAAIPRSERARAAARNQPVNVRRKERGGKRTSERIARQQGKSDSVEKSGDKTEPTNVKLDSTPTNTAVGNAPDTPASNNEVSKDSDDEVVFVKEVRRRSPQRSLPHVPEDEVIFIADSRGPRTRRARKEPSKPTPSGIDPNGEVETVGCKHGVRPNIDYPHLRFSCGVHKFALGPAARAHCEKCFCYVCDTPAAQCTDWDVHSQATDKSSMFRRMRADHRNRRNLREKVVRRTTVKPHTPVLRRTADAPFLNTQSDRGYAPSRYGASGRDEYTCTTESETSQTSPRSRMVLRSHARENPRKHPYNDSNDTRPARRQRRS